MDSVWWQLDPTEWNIPSTTTKDHYSSVVANGVQEMLDSVDHGQGPSPNHQRLERLLCLSREFNGAQMHSPHLRPLQERLPQPLADSHREIDLIGGDARKAVKRQDFLPPVGEFLERWSDFV